MRAECGAQGLADSCLTLSCSNIQRRLGGKASELLEKISLTCQRQVWAAGGISVHFGLRFLGIDPVTVPPLA